MKFQWWLAKNDIPIEYSNKMNRKELLMLQNIIEEEIKSNE